jgi:hypothetical protein
MLTVPTHRLMSRHSERAIRGTGARAVGVRSELQAFPCAGSTCDAYASCACSSSAARLPPATDSSRLQHCTQTLCHGCLTGQRGLRLEPVSVEPLWPGGQEPGCLCAQCPQATSKQRMRFAHWERAMQSVQASLGLPSEELRAGPVHGFVSGCCGQRHSRLSRCQMLLA